MNFNWNKKKRLKNAGTTLTHYNKLKSLIMIVEKLISHCEKIINARNKIYKIYFNNQISLKMIHVMSSMLDQKRLQKIQMTMNKICNYNAQLKLHWIFDYADIKGNKIIDKITEKIYSFILSSFERLYYEVTTRISFIRVSSRKIWDKKWKERTKEI